MNIEEIKELLVPYLNDNNLSLFDVELVKEDGNLILRVLVDKDGGIDVDSLAMVNEFLSEKLDVFDKDMPEYFLEVSSPGIERKLKDMDDIIKHIGSYIHVEIPDMIYEGYLESVLDDTLAIKINAKGRFKTVNVIFKDITNIRLAVKF